MRIGFATLQDIVFQQSVASTRIRVEYVIKHLDDYVISSKYRDLKDCDVVVLQTRYENFELVKKLSDAGVKLILDVTDPHWDLRYDPSGTARKQIERIMPYVDVVTVPTENLKTSFLKFSDKVEVIVWQDRFDLEMHDKVKVHSDKKEYTICWHGSYGNRVAISQAREDLEKLGKEFNIKLLAVYDRVKENKLEPFKNLRIEAVEWSNKETIYGLLDSDISINPTRTCWKNYKSNNKTVKSWLLGVPCVTENTYKEAKKLLSSLEYRIKESDRLRKKAVKEYDSKISAKELVGICKKIKAPKKIYKKKSIVVVTSIVGGDDWLREDQFIDKDCDYIAYTDNKVKSNVWEIRDIEHRKFIESRWEAKIYKVLIHLIDNYDYSLWIDGTIAVKASVTEMIKRFLKTNDMALFKHCKRDCIYDEYIADMAHSRHDNAEPMAIRERQRERYKADGVKPKSGLFECGVILRKHTDKIKRFNNEWWSELTTASPSDQVPFMYTLFKNPDVKVTPITPGDMYESEWAEYIPHGNKVVDGVVKPNVPDEVIPVEINQIKDDDDVWITYIKSHPYTYSKVGTFSHNATKKMKGVHAKHLLKSHPDKFIVCKEP